MHTTLQACILAGVAAFSAPASAFAAEEVFAMLAGGNQVGLAGSPTGRGTATLERANANLICYGVLTVGVDKPTELHIHRGVAGVNGDVVVALTPPAAGNPGTIAGCVAVVDKKLVEDIFDNPRKFYVNVHSVKFPEGAIRGQLF